MSTGNYIVETAASLLPVSLTEAKAHLKVDFDDEDTMIELYINAAVDYAEQYTNRGLMTQTIKQTLDCFPTVTNSNKFAKIKLFRTPVTSVTSITYINTDGDATVLSSDDYVVIKTVIPAVIAPKDSNTFPTTANQPGAVVLEYECGVGSADDIPASVKAAILLLVGEMYEKRENFVKSMPDAVKYLLNQYKVHQF